MQSEQFCGGAIERKNLCKSKMGVSQAFAKNSKTYIVGLEENSATKTIKTRSVRFNDDEFYFGTKEGHPSVNNVPYNQDHDTVINSWLGE